MNKGLRRTAAATAAVLAAAIGAQLWWSHLSGAVPGRAHLPWPWQETVAGSAPGPAKLVYTTDKTLSFEATTVVVGRNGYRIQDQMGNGTPVELSPDGTRLLVLGGGSGAAAAGVLDLRTGKTRRLPGGAPLGWSHDGRQILAHDTEGRINLVDADAGTVRTVLQDRGADQIGDAIGISPDGQRIAMSVTRRDGQHLQVVDASGTVLWQHADNAVEHIAWSADGRSIAAFVDRSGLRVAVFAAADGAEVRSYAVPHGQRVLGFRGADVVVSQGGTGVRTRIVQVGDGGERTLARVPDDQAGNPLVPLDLVERGDFGGPDALPNPFQARWWLYIGLAVLGLVFIAKSAPGPPAPKPREEDEEELAAVGK